MNTPKRSTLAISCCALILSACDTNKPADSQTTPANPAAKTAAATKPVAQPAPTPAPAPAPVPATNPTPTSGPTEIAGLTWSIPSNWKNIGPSGMRIAEYAATDPAGGPGVTIRFYSTMGTAQAHIDRWKTQIAEPTDGPTTKTIAAAHLKTQAFAATGVFTGMGPTGTPLPPQSNARFLGAFVEGGPKPVQVVAYGPDSQVRGIEKAWAAMLASIK